jgi:predicted ATPase
MKPSPESITIKRLGPIAEARIDPGPLTILIGEQASGKSLIAQVVFFFRAIKSLAARYYTPELISKPKWQESLVKSILDDLRGVPFGYFADGSANLKYKAGKSNGPSMYIKEIEWSASTNNSNYTWRNWRNPGKK